MQVGDPIKSDNCALSCDRPSKVYAIQCKRLRLPHVWLISAIAAAIGGPLKFFRPHAKYQMHDMRAKPTNTTDASVCDPVSGHSR